VTGIGNSAGLHPRDVGTSAGFVRQNSRKRFVSNSYKTGTPFALLVTV